MNFYYFDNAATTRLDNDVLREMLPYSNIAFGNASSSYKLGRNSKNAIENSRNKVANILGCKPNEVYFTSGGTESDNTALKGIARANRNKGNHIITSSIEHPAVLESCKELEEELSYEVNKLENVDTSSVEAMKQMLLPLCVISVVSTILIMVVTGRVSQGIIRRKKEGAGNE